MTTFEENLKSYIVQKRGQVVVMREGGSDYQLRTADEIEARIARLESGEETLPGDFFDEPRPIKQTRKRASAKRTGNPAKVDIDAAETAYRQANGDKQLAWSKYVIIKGLRPGCDAKDLYAYLEG